MPSLSFKGKALVQNHHLSVPYHQLVPKKDKGLDAKPSLDGNLIVHGDNLKALKALLPTLAGKVKCIYIDPPYNTGGEWVYNDNVNSPMIQEWLGKAVDRDDLTRHDKWLCMMLPRLRLLRELLRDDGVIFISADDNEAHHLRVLMDELFQGHFVGQLIWRKKEGGGQTDTYFVTEHEYVLVYAKSDAFEWIDEKVALNRADFRYKDDKGDYARVRLAKWGSAARREDRPKMYFSLEAPDKTKVYPKAPDGGEGRWRVGEARMDVLLEDDRVDWEKKDGQWIAYEKKYFSEGDFRVVKERSILYDLATTGDASKLLTDIFGKKDVFENPKPYQIIRFILEHTTAGSEIVLDAFAGSGTTGHAVLAANREDGAKRRFILVEEQGYVDSITAERMRRIIKGVPKAKSDPSVVRGFKESFSFFTLGKAMDIEGILSGATLPSFDDLARYVFFTATSQNWDARKIDSKSGFIGSTKSHDVYLLYAPNVEELKKLALTRERALSFGKLNGKRRLVFAPTKYLDQEQLDELKIDFAQLPFEIYKRAG